MAGDTANGKEVGCAVGVILASNSVGVRAGNVFVAAGCEGDRRVGCAALGTRGAGGEPTSVGLKDRVGDDGIAVEVAVAWSDWTL